MKKSAPIFLQVLRTGTIVLYLLQQSTAFSTNLQAAEIAPSPAEKAIPEISLKEIEATKESSLFSKNADDENPLSPATPETAAALVTEKTADVKISLRDLPPNAVRTASNPNFYYAERKQAVSAPSVYDIYNSRGIKIMTVNKDAASIRGNSSSAISVPDISADGQFLILGTLEKSAYTGHKTETLYITIYDIKTTRQVPPSIKLLEKDNQTIASSEIPTEIRFSPENSNLIRVTNSQSGQISYYDVITHQQVQTLPANAVVTVSNPNFYYVERIQGGSTPKVYDIYSKDGIKLFTIDKEQANIQGNYSYAVGVPDVSPDGQTLILGKFQQMFYTGHKIQTLSVGIFNIAQKRWEAPPIKLLEKDNDPILPSEIPTDIRFVPGNPAYLQVLYPSGQTDYYNIATRSRNAKSAALPVSRPFLQSATTGTVSVTEFMNSLKK